MTDEIGDGAPSDITDSLDKHEEITAKTDPARLFAVRVGMAIRESGRRALALGDNVTELGNSLAGSTLARRRAKLCAIDAELSCAIAHGYDLVASYEDARTLIRDHANQLALAISRKDSP